MKRHGYTLFFLLSTLFVIACGKDSVRYAPAEDVSRDLLAACPESEISNERTRDTCALAIGRSVALYESMNELVHWGRFSYEESASLDPQAHSELTRLGSLTARRAYVSLFAFTGEGVIEKIDVFTVLRMPVRFRNTLPLGAYPEPFWFERSLWDAYQGTEELLFVWQDERIVAIYLDGSNPALVTRDVGPLVTDWNWIDDDGTRQPYASRFSYLFSAGNPYVGELEEIYGSFDRAMREADCVSCHVPSNPAMLQHISLLSYPNQMLGLRSRLVVVFENNAMPPGVGLEDHVVEELRFLARTFDRVADLAIAAEAP